MWLFGFWFTGHVVKGNCSRERRLDGQIEGINGNATCSRGLALVGVIVGSAKKGRETQRESPTSYISVIHGHCHKPRPCLAHPEDLYWSDARKLLRRGDRMELVGGLGK